MKYYYHGKNKGYKEHILVIDRNGKNVRGYLKENRVWRKANPMWIPGWQLPKTATELTETEFNKMVFISEL